MPEETNASPKMQFDENDIKQNKVVAALAYIVFFIPLIAAKDSKFGKEHAKQGLVLLILAIIIWIAGTVIPILGWFIIGPFGTLLVAIVAIIAIIKTLQGEFWEIPLIGKYRHSFKF